MKIPSVLVGAAALVTAVAAHAGPSIRIVIAPGGGCQRPVYCQPQPVCQRVFYPQCAPAVFYNTAPVFTGGTVTRFSNVSGFVNGGQGVIQISEPIYPVVVYPQNTFRWR